MQVRFSTHKWRYLVIPVNGARQSQSYYGTLTAFRMFSIEARGSLLTYFDQLLQTYHGPNDLDKDLYLYYRDHKSCLPYHTQFFYYI